MTTHLTMSKDLSKYINAYRRQVIPGVYFFHGIKGKAENIVGIQETREGYINQMDNSRFSVSFGYLEHGYPAIDRIGQNPTEWLRQYPEIGDISFTSESYQAALLDHLKEKVCLAMKKNDWR